MSWILHRTLADCDDGELVELEQHLRFLAVSGYEWASVGEKEDHEARLCEVLAEVDRRGGQLTFQELQDLIRRADSR